VTDKVGTKAIGIDPIRAEQELNLMRHERVLARRSFVKNIGLGAVAFGAGSLLVGCGGVVGNTSAQSIPETDVLNFALNLEYLEAEFYSVAVTGTTLSSTVTGAISKAAGGKKVTFTDPILAAIAAEIAADEKLHVQYLRTALGGLAVAEPAINLDALGIGFNSETEFLTLSRAFEDTGVSAYAGAATLLTGNNLQAAAQILAVEAYHAGNIRLKIVEHVPAITVAATDSLDVPPNMPHFFPTDPNGLAIKRTPSQVLKIVYATTATGISSGGFFPSGLNGNIKTT
jgi:hypothetical protein